VLWLIHCCRFNYRFRWTKVVCLCTYDAYCKFSRIAFLQPKRGVTAHQLWLALLTLCHRYTPALAESYSASSNAVAGRRLIINSQRAYYLLKQSPHLALNKLRLLDACTVSIICVHCWIIVCELGIRPRRNNCWTKTPTAETLKPIRARECRVRGVSWPPPKKRSWGQKLHMALMSDCRCESNHDSKGWGENQRIMLHDKTWFLTLTSLLKNGYRAPDWSAFSNVCPIRGRLFRAAILLHSVMLNEYTACGHLPVYHWITFKGEVNRCEL